MIYMLTYVYKDLIPYLKNKSEDIQIILYLSPLSCFLGIIYWQNIYANPLIDTLIKNTQEKY